MLTINIIKVIGLFAGLSIFLALLLIVLGIYASATVAKLRSERRDMVSNQIAQEVRPPECEALDTEKERPEILASPQESLEGLSSARTRLTMETQHANASGSRLRASHGPPVRYKNSTGDST